MKNPENRKFNVNDITGDFDRDEKGNLIPLKNKKGFLVDKLGRPVNEKGYLIDKKSGDVLENEKMSKMFDKGDLDETGEIFPPFNLERYNFNPHDIRGHFDKDKDGNEIIGNKKDARGRNVDKFGRLVN